MLRADVYQALAEALAPDGPPDWLAGSGRDWPLYEIALCLAPESQAARRAVVALADLPAEALAARRARCAALFAGAGRPRFWLYESAFLTGRILGPVTLAVEKLYRAAGLAITSAELPDHAALELAFLAHLSGREATSPEEKRFLQQHAGRWLPALGRGLARSGDAVYAALGQLLADWLEETHTPPPASKRRGERRMPSISRSDACTLCGFCVPVCPTRALAIRETAAQTTLALNAAACVSCGKCESVCAAAALSLNRTPAGATPGGGWTALRVSVRAICPACGRPTVSRAELDFVAAQIGHPAWLDYCHDCRPEFWEQQR